MSFGFLAGDAESCFGVLTGEPFADNVGSVELGFLRLKDCFEVACCEGVVEVEARVTRRVGVDSSKAYCCRAPLNVVVRFKLSSESMVFARVFDAIGTLFMLLDIRTPTWEW